MGIGVDAFGAGWLLAVAFIAFASVIVLAGMVTVVVLIAVNVRRARALGLNPLTVQTDLTARILHADALAPTRSTTERLAELDRLLAAGSITTAEHAAARADVLRG